MPDPEFAKRLANAMSAAGLTQGELAERVGVSQPTISRWLSGSMPKGRSAIMLCEVLKVAHQCLFFGVEKGQPFKFTEEMRGRLIEARKKSGMTLTEIARASHYSEKEFEAVEKGRVTPLLRMLAIWQHRLNLNERWLFEGEGEMFLDTPALYFIPPWEIEKSRLRAKALREQADFLMNQAARLEWEIEQSEEDFKETGRDDLRIIRRKRAH